jgi:hypothetical protein
MCLRARLEQDMLGTILIVVLILALLGALPRWSTAATGVTPLPVELGWSF